MRVIRQRQRRQPWRRITRLRANPTYALPLNHDRLDTRRLRQIRRRPRRLGTAGKRPAVQAEQATGLHHPQRTQGRRVWRQARPTRFRIVGARVGAQLQIEAAGQRRRGRHGDRRIDGQHLRRHFRLHHGARLHRRIDGNGHHGRRQRCRFGRRAGSQDGIDIGRQQPFHDHLVAALAQEAQFQRRRVGHVDHARGVEGATIIDAHDHLFAAVDARHTRIRRNRQGGMGRRHLVHVVDFTRRSALAMEFLAIPGARALLRKWFVVGDRRVRLAEDDIRAVRARRIRLVAHFRIGHVAQVGRRIVARAVILVVAAAPGAGRRQRRQGGVLAHGHLDLAA